MTAYIVVRNNISLRTVNAGEESEREEDSISTEIHSAFLSLSHAKDRVQLLNAHAGFMEFYSLEYCELNDFMADVNDLLGKYGIKTKEDLDVILAEYFAEVKEHTFRCTGGEPND